MLNPPPPPSIFQIQPNYAKHNLFKTDNLQALNVFLESNKNKNFNIEYNGLLTGNNLKEAEEYTNRINYGVKTLGGGVFSLNATNQKLVGQKQDQSYLGFSYNLSSKFTSIDLNYKNVNSLFTNYNNNSLMEINIRSRF